MSYIWKVEPHTFKIIFLCQYVDIFLLEACSIAHCKRSEGTNCIVDKVEIINYMIDIYTSHYDMS